MPRNKAANVKGRGSGIVGERAFRGGDREGLVNGKQNGLKEPSLRNTSLGIIRVSGERGARFFRVSCRSITMEVRSESRESSRIKCGEVCLTVTLNKCKLHPRGMTLEDS